MAVMEESLEVGCLHVGLISARNIKRVKQGGMSDLLGLSPQAEPYCKFTLGECEFTSGVGVRTTGGHAWNREQFCFPVKVPSLCVIGGCGRWHPTAWRRGSSNSASNVGTPGGPPKPGGSDHGVACGSSLSRAVAAADAATAHDVWRRLTLRVQVFHREGRDGGGTGAGGAATGKADKERGGVAPETATAAAECSDTGGETSASTAVKAKGYVDAGSSDRLLGECSLNLLEVVSGRAPHIEEWVPLDSEGDLRLSLDYDSVGELPVPGDSVVLLCLSNRLDFFPLPVWDIADDPARPGSPSWLWARGPSLRWLRERDSGGSAGFRVEEAGDDFFLISYASPEGWRCAVEVHRFLVLTDPASPRRWTLADVRDHAIATPAAAALRGAVLRVSQEDSLWDGGKDLALNVLRGVSWTAARWWGGGLDRVRDDVYFAVGLMDYESFAQSEQNNREQQQEQQQGERGGEEGGIREDKEEDNDQVGDREQPPPPPPPPQQQQQQHLCPITRCPIEDPAVAADGYTYERAAIERWLSEHDTSPVTGKVLETKAVFKNWSLVSSSSSFASSYSGRRT